MMTVADKMEKKLLTLRPDTSLKDAYKLMVDKNVRHILITDEGGGVLGIISDRDIKKFASPFAGSSLETDRDKATMLLKVGSIMIKEIVSVKSDDSLKNCVSKMLDKNIHAIPVLDEGKKAVGIITSTDMLRLLVSKLR